MKKLLIVESPAKIKTISKFLGKEFTILATMGHVKDLPPKEIGVTIDDTAITLTYVVLDKKEKTIADICKEARTADEIFLAPDPDREGEIIAWHVAQEIAKVAKKTSKIHRISFNEITQSAIKEAIAHPSHINEERVAAQQARRILDRWVGYEVSPVLWKKIAKGLSAGRVQSVALRLICDREESIRNFKPEEYWSIHAIFVYEKTAFSAALTHINKKKIEIKDQKKAAAIVQKLQQLSYIITSIKDTKRERAPYAPFMTSTLQQAAYNQLGFSVTKTMQIAQKLYEGIPLQDPSTPIALITYMRTDSLRIADTAIQQVREFITKTYGKEYLPSKTQVYAKGKAQDAHEAIRPIDTEMTPESVGHYLDNDTARLYALIWKRFVACQMEPAEYAQRAVIIDSEGYSFRITGSTLLFDGFLKVYAASENEEDESDSQKVTLPKSLKEKEPVDLQEVTPKQHFTQALPRFTEASLVKELEKAGIGRPSTYATIMKTIQARSYTTLDTKKRFLPTELGMAVVNILIENLPKIMDISFTATMEEDLDKVAHGELKRDTLLRDFYTTFEQDLAKFKGEPGKKAIELTNIVCPECKTAQLGIRFGKTGSFLGCMGFPTCKFTSNFERLEDGTITLLAATAPLVLEEKCPKCAKPLRQIVGRFGPFIACSGYPECKYIHVNVAKFPCPLCKGEIIERSWKGKKFWGCRNYPTCKFSIPGEIEQIACPECKKPYLLKKIDKDGNTILTCHNKECGYSK